MISVQHYTSRIKDKNKKFQLQINIMYGSYSKFWLIYSIPHRSMQRVNNVSKDIIIKEILCIVFMVLVNYYRCEGKYLTRNIIYNRLVGQLTDHRFGRHRGVVISESCGPVVTIARVPLSCPTSCPAQADLLQDCHSLYYITILSFDSATATLQTDQLCQQLRSRGTTKY